jgi:hypothetical protein
MLCGRYTRIRAATKNRYLTPHDGNYYYGTGRRKSPSHAKRKRHRQCRHDKAIDTFFGRETGRMVVR